LMMMETKVVRITDLINPNFYPVWRTKKPHVVLSGGRSSMKSSVISLKLVTDFLNDDQGNVICLHEVGKYRPNSVYEQIKLAIYMLNWQDEFLFRQSPVKIIHKATNTAFYFFDVHNTQKLKAAKIAKGYVRALRIEQ